MNRRELCEALAAAGVPDALYEIPGFHELSLKPPDFAYLRQEGVDWVVGSFERGLYRPLNRFDSEDAACRFLLAQLTYRGGGPDPGAEDEMRSVLEDRDEIERAAREAFERARRTEP
ncbi:hypothetical protein [Streptomyces sp. GC420]|uniref:hypothetical protein n=1 Tax=Streptomyces sp. GC420 TaxID=2697568 RepID=UPI001AA16585|nr:hypothetical protein [Streptomyces sp. GC420]